MLALCLILSSDMSRKAGSLHFSVKMSVVASCVWYYLDGLMTVCSTPTLSQTRDSISMQLCMVVVNSHCTRVGCKRMQPCMQPCTVPNLVHWHYSGHLIRHAQNSLTPRNFANYATCANRNYACAFHVSVHSWEFSNMHVACCDSFLLILPA